MDDQRQDLLPFDEHARTVSLQEPPRVVAMTRALLGGRIAAFIGHATHVRTVNEWIPGAEVAPELEPRFRAACFASALLSTREGKATNQSWFQRRVPKLNNQSPAGLLADCRLEGAVEQVERAARSFWVYEQSPRSRRHSKRRRGIQ